MVENSVVWKAKKLAAMRDDDLVDMKVEVKIFWMVGGSVVMMADLKGH